MIQDWLNPPGSTFQVPGLQVYTVFHMGAEHVNTASHATWQALCQLASSLAENHPFLNLQGGGLYL